MLTIRVDSRSRMIQITTRVGQHGSSPISAVSVSRQGFAQAAGWLLGCTGPAAPPVWPVGATHPGGVPMTIMVVHRYHQTLV